MYLLRFYEYYYYPDTDSTVVEFKLDTSTVGLSVLVGFTAGVVLPLGKASVEISVDFVTAFVRVEVFIIQN